MKTIKSQPLRTANCEVVSMEGIGPLFVRIGDLHMHALFGVVENLAVDMILGTSFIDCSVRGLFSSERKIVLSNSRPVAIILTEKKVNEIADNTKEVDRHTIAERGTPAKEHYLSLVACQVTRPAYLQLC